MQGMQYGAGAAGVTDHRGYKKIGAVAKHLSAYNFEGCIGDEMYPQCTQYREFFNVNYKPPATPPQRDFFELLQASLTECSVVFSGDCGRAGFTGDLLAGLETPRAGSVRRDVQLQCAERRSSMCG